MSGSSDAPIREKAMQLVQSLPPVATWDDLMYRIYVRQAIEAGIRDADANRVVDVSEVRHYLNKARGQNVDRG